MNMNTSKDYYDLYLKVNFLLLVCMFETFRKESINSFELDLAHYLSTPGYCWNAMVMVSNVNLKRMPDIEKYQFIETTMRGGISMICKSDAKSDNKLLKLNDANKSRSYIIYLDANNLHGHSPMQLFQTEILDWLIQNILV